MEIGIGIHGEPGVRKDTMKNADSIVDELLEKILGDLDYKGSDVAVMINGCGATPLMELYAYGTGAVTWPWFCAEINQRPMFTSGDVLVYYNDISDAYVVKKYV